MKRTERIVILLTHEDKCKIEEAAEKTHMTASTFSLVAALEKINFMSPSAATPPAPPTGQS